MPILDKSYSIISLREVAESFTLQSERTYTINEEFGESGYEFIYKDSKNNTVVVTFYNDESEEGEKITPDVVLSGIVNSEIYGFLTDELNDKEGLTIELSVIPLIMTNCVIIYDPIEISSVGDIREYENSIRSFEDYKQYRFLVIEDQSVHELKF